MEALRTPAWLHFAAPAPSSPLSAILIASLASLASPRPRHRETLRSPPKLVSAPKLSPSALGRPIQPGKCLGAACPQVARFRQVPAHLLPRLSW